MTVFLPILFNPSPNPTVVVDFPSPALVGLIAVTKISFASFLSAFFFNKSKLNLALYFP